MNYYYFHVSYLKLKLVWSLNYLQQPRITKATSKTLVFFKSSDFIFMHHKKLNLINQPHIALLLHTLSHTVIHKDNTNIQIHCSDLGGALNINLSNYYSR